MNEASVQDSLKTANHILNESSSIYNSARFWMWIALIECIIIIFILLKNKIFKPNTLKEKLKNDSLKEEVDFNNIINSSFNSTKLYDELKVKCHPDRFPNDEGKSNIALKLFQEISKNRTNLKRLNELKAEAEQKLNINF